MLQNIGPISHSSILVISGCVLCAVLFVVIGGTGSGTRRKMELATTKCAVPRKRRPRRPRRSVEMTLFTYVSSQCLQEQHTAQDICPRRNCHYNNIECLVKLLRSARKQIKIAMYTFSVRDFFDACLYAKERHGVNVKVIQDTKMRQTQGSVFMDMVENDFELQTNNGNELMHHKFVIIDPVEPLDEDEPYYSSEGDSEPSVGGGAGFCDSCKCSDNEKMKANEICECGARVQINSCEQLIQYAGQEIPKLPKYGLLITGSLNWTAQALRENYENVIVTSHWQHIRDFNREFDHLWSNVLPNA